ncbi:hypothetical protein M0R72_01720 [Candidatus Pacearchaeota archaeon]|jgi:hypothetical protein|nr:hypothetical protein [Candidatus Pacearchaeota archaeon]
MHEHLQIWYDWWVKEHQASNLIYAKGSDGPCLKQVHFIRDNIARLFWAGISYYDIPRCPPPREDCRETAIVISEHTSKSVRLPVYSFERKDIWLRLTLRYNFYNWKLSVESQSPILADFSGLFFTTPPVEPEYTGNELHPVYFEGFPEDRIFGYYENDHCKFSAEIGSHEKLWTAIFLIMRDLGKIKPYVWNTQESHRKALDEESARSKR